VSILYQTKALIYFLLDELPAEQRRSWTLTTPPNLQHPTPSYNSSSFEDIDTSVLGRVPTSVNANFIDAVAHSMGFQAADEDYRSSLHSIPMVSTLAYRL
jgi:hypothetical protein